MQNRGGTGWISGSESSLPIRSLPNKISDLITSAGKNPTAVLGVSQIVIVASAVALLATRFPTWSDSLSWSAFAGTEAAMQRDAYRHAWTLSSVAPRLLPAYGLPTVLETVRSGSDSAFSSGVSVTLGLPGEALNPWIAEVGANVSEDAGAIGTASSEVHRFSVHLLYYLGSEQIPGDGNLLTTRGLTSIRNFEARLVSERFWSSLCDRHSDVSTESETSVNSSSSTDESASDSTYSTSDSTYSTNSSMESSSTTTTTTTTTVLQDGDCNPGESLINFIWPETPEPSDENEGPGLSGLEGTDELAFSGRGLARVPTDIALGALSPFLGGGGGGEKVNRVWRFLPLDAVRQDGFSEPFASGVLQSHFLFSSKNGESQESWKSRVNRFIESLFATLDASSQEELIEEGIEVVYWGKELERYQLYEELRLDCWWASLPAVATIVCVVLATRPAPWAAIAILVAIESCFLALGFHLHFIGRSSVCVVAALLVFWGQLAIADVLVAGLVSMRHRVLARLPLDAGAFASDRRILSSFVSLFLLCLAAFASLLIGPNVARELALMTGFCLSVGFFLLFFTFPIVLEITVDDTTAPCLPQLRKAQPQRWPKMWRVTQNLVARAVDVLHARNGCVLLLWTAAVLLSCGVVLSCFHFEADDLAIFPESHRAHIAKALLSRFAPPGTVASASSSLRQRAFSCPLDASSGASDTLRLGTALPSFFFFGPSSSSSSDDVDGSQSNGSSSSSSSTSSSSSSSSDAAYDCEDRDAGCGAWAATGECERHPDLMGQVCPRSCGSCSFCSRMVCYTDAVPSFAAPATLGSGGTCSCYDLGSTPYVEEIEGSEEEVTIAALVAGIPATGFQALSSTLADLFSKISSSLLSASALSSSGFDESKSTNSTTSLPPLVQEHWRSGSSYLYPLTSLPLFTAVARNPSVSNAVAVSSSDNDVDNVDESTADNNSSKVSNNNTNNSSSSSSGASASATTSSTSSSSRRTHLQLLCLCGGLEPCSEVGTLRGVSESYPNILEALAASGIPNIFDASDASQIQVTVLWGLRPSVATVFPPQLSDTDWNFEETFRLDDPWAQRVVLTLATTASSHLPFVFEERNQINWFQEFEGWLKEEGKSFPTLDIHSEVLEFCRQKSEFWRNIIVVGESVRALRMGFVSSGNGIASSSSLEVLADLKYRWDEFVESSNLAASETANTAVHTARAWLRVDAFNRLQSGLVGATLLALSGCCLITVIFLRNWLLALYIILFALGGAWLQVAFIVGALGYELGQVECVVLVVSMAQRFGFLIHLASAYAGAGKLDLDGTPVEGGFRSMPSTQSMNSDEGMLAERERRHRTRGALRRTFPSVTGSACLQAFAAVALIPCTLTYLRRAGIILLATVIISWVESMLILPALLLAIGPNSFQTPLDHLSTTRHKLRTQLRRCCRPQRSCLKLESIAYVTSLPQQLAKDVEAEQQGLEGSFSGVCPSSQPIDASECEENEKRNGPKHKKKKERLIPNLKKAALPHISPEEEPPPRFHGHGGVLLQSDDRLILDCVGNRNGHPSNGLMSAGRPGPFPHLADDSGTGPDDDDDEEQEEQEEDLPDQQPEGGVPDQAEESASSSIEKRQASGSSTASQVLQSFHMAPPPPLSPEAGDGEEDGMFLEAQGRVGETESFEGFGSLVGSNQLTTRRQELEQQQQQQQWSQQQQRQRQQQQQQQQQVRQRQHSHQAARRKGSKLQQQQQQQQQRDRAALPPLTWGSLTGVHPASSSSAAVRRLDENSCWGQIAGDFEVGGSSGSDFKPRGAESSCNPGAAKGGGEGEARNILAPETPAATAADAAAAEAAEAPKRVGIGIGISPPGAVGGSTSGQLGGSVAHLSLGPVGGLGLSQTGSLTSNGFGCSFTLGSLSASKSLATSSSELSNSLHHPGPSSALQGQEQQEQQEQQQQQRQRQRQRQRQQQQPQQQQPSEPALGHTSVTQAEGNGGSHHVEGKDNQGAVSASGVNLEGPSGAEDAAVHQSSAPPELA